jgi:Zn-dependent protease with chaperone function
MTKIGFVILVILVMIGAYIFIELGGMPGKTARERGHPQADAIAVLGWLGLLFGGVGWVIAMVWSRMQPLQISGAGVAEPEKIVEDPDAS